MTMYPLVDYPKYREPFSTLAELMVAVDMLDPTLNYPLSWHFHDEDQDDEPFFSIAIMMPRRTEVTQFEFRGPLNRAEVDAWLNSTIRARVAAWYGWDEGPEPTREHDHTGQPKVWCTRCQHEHIAAIPATTYECDSCGFAQWDLGTARLHEAQQDGHRAYPIAHPTVPLDERPAQPSAAGVLREVVTRIDEARYANGDGGSPWDNTDVLGLLAHLRQPYAEGGATAPPEIDRLREIIESAPHDEHCDLGEPDPRAYGDLVAEQPRLPCTCWKSVVE